jgi:hypothetical protein
LPVSEQLVCGGLACCFKRRHRRDLTGLVTNQQTRLPILRRNEKLPVTGDKDLAGVQQFFLPPPDLICRGLGLLGADVFPIFDRKIREQGEHRTGNTSSIFTEPTLTVGSRCRGLPRQRGAIPVARCG